MKRIIPEIHLIMLVTIFLCVTNIPNTVFSQTSETTTEENQNMNSDPSIRQGDSQQPDSFWDLLEAEMSGPTLKSAIIGIALSLLVLKKKGIKRFFPYTVGKTIHLKVASMLLFWFGVVAQSIIVFVVAVDYATLGYSRVLMPLGPDNILVQAHHVAYMGFAHFIHIVSAYWLAKGRKKGVVLGLCISAYEIVTFVLPPFNPGLFTPDGFAIRILFAVIIYFIVSGAGELDRLQLENWRPWKNPRTTSTQ
jgi:hypothetical protein